MMAKISQRKPKRGARASQRPPAASLRQAPDGNALTHSLTPVYAGWPDLAALAAGALGPLLLYVSTLPPTVVLEDDGLFLMAGVHLGIAHPPGYPLYTLIVHLFTRLPFGDAAFLGHLSSAVLGALACGGVYCCARLLGASLVPALTAAWLFGVSEQFWSQAIITEVYTFNALLFFTTYALVLLGARDPRRGWPLLAAAVTWGAGLANHLPLMVLATPGLLLALLPAWREVVRRLPRLIGAAFLSAALPYGWMVWMSQQAPLISFYGAIDTWSDFWFYISRQGYSGVDVSASAGWSDRWSFLWWFARDLARQSTLPGVALAILGLGALARRRGRAAAAAAGSGLLALVGNSVVLILLLGFDFDELRVAVFRPYPLICYGVAALWLAAGMQYLLDRLPDWTAARLPTRSAGVSRAHWIARGTTTLAALTGAAMVVASASANWRVNDRSRSDFTEWYANLIFDALPQDAVLFADSDGTAVPLGYFRYVEERRPDVTLYNQQALVFSNRLYDPFLPEEEKEKALERFVDSTDRAVFLTRDFGLYPAQRSYRIHGFLREARKSGAADTAQLVRDAREEQYFLELLDRQPIDRWEQKQRNELLAGYGRYLGLIALSDSAAVLELMEALFQRAQDCYSCLIGMATVLLDNAAAAHVDRISAWLARAEALHDQALRKEESAKLHFELGRLAELTGNAATAAAHYRQAHAIYPHPQSQSSAALRRLGLTP